MFGRLIIRGLFANEIWGGGGHLFLEGLIIGILHYSKTSNELSFWIKCTAQCGGVVTCSGLIVHQIFNRKNPEGCLSLHPDVQKINGIQ